MEIRLRVEDRVPSPNHRSRSAQLNYLNAMNRIVVVTVLLSGCSIVPRDQPWSFVTAVGGMAIDAPVRTPKGISLPMRANVSGLETITVAPTTLNSIMACSRTRAKIGGQEIYLTIATSLARAGDSPRCPPARLGALRAGEYQVSYGTEGTDATPLGVIHVAL